MKPKRVGIVGLLQESNTFIQGKTTLQHFREDLFLTGDEILTQMTDAPHEVGGFIEVLQHAEVDIVPIFLGRAVPYGIIEASTFTELVSTLVENLEGAWPIDGVLAAPHGATVAENHPDADGFWLGEVRRMIGPKTPLIATIDPHANLSPMMVDTTDAIIAYSTNPHLDQRETGRKAATLMIRTLNNEIRPVQAAAFPPMAINIQSQNTNQEPLKNLCRSAKVICDRTEALSHSIVLGFPYADVSEMGSSTVVVTDNDLESAESTSEALKQILWDSRDDYEPEFLSPEKAVEKAIKDAQLPTVLLDMGDNVGGGSPADGTTLLHQLQDKQAHNAFVCLYDPISVSQAVKAGEGSTLSLRVGGKTDNLHGSSFTGTFEVCSIHQGKFTEPETRHGGYTDYNQGLTAVVKTIDTRITVMLTSKRVPPFSLAQLTAFGLDPTKFDLLVAKGVIAPLAAYRPIAKSFLFVDTPGVTRADMRKLKYQNRRQPMFPFERSSEGLQ